MIFKKVKYDVITIGGATEDITFYTHEGVLIDNKDDLTKQKLLAFEYGAKVKIDKAFSNFGGGAANTAVNFSGLGFKTACLISLGNDGRAQRILDNLKKHKVDTRLAQKIKGHKTGFSFLLVGPSNEHIVFSNRAANNELRIKNYELRILKNARWIYLTSLSGQWQDVLKKLFTVNEAKIAWNPGHRQIITGISNLGKYIRKTQVLILNNDEATELVLSDKNYKNKPKQFFANMNNLLKILFGYGAKIVVITSGKKGADAYDGKKFYHQPVVKETKRADTTGVGDAFGSSFVAGLELFKHDIKKALYLGAKNTASVISQPGAQNGFLTKNDLKKLRLL